jgi:hypothetical protein
MLGSMEWRIEVAASIGFVPVAWLFELLVNPQVWQGEIGGLLLEIILCLVNTTSRMQCSLKFSGS